MISSIGITGATGFIGQALVTALSNQGVKVIALSRQISARLPRAVDQMVIGNLTIDTDISHILKSCDVIIHLAGRAHILNETVADNLEGFCNVNTDATIKLAQQALKAGVRRFVFISSIGVNGNRTRQPFTEADSANPQGPYAISKYEAEQHLLTLTKGTAMELVIIRPPLVYGPNAPGNFATLMKILTHWKFLPLGAVNNRRSFIALDNLVSFIILCADREKTPKAANQVFLISDGEDVSTTKLLRKIADAISKRVWLLPVPVWMMNLVARSIGKTSMANRLFDSLQIDSTKARNLLGWKPVTTMDEQLNKIANET